MIPEEELLALIDKTEEEQYNWLAENKVLKPDATVVLYLCHIGRPESLADLADRLWKRANIKTIFPIATVYEYMYPEIEVTQANRCSMMEWLAMDALPIHRIIAAIIAIHRSGEKA